MIPFHLFKYHKQLNCEFVVKDYVTQFTKKNGTQQEGFTKDCFSPRSPCFSMRPRTIPQTPLDYNETFYYIVPYLHASLLCALRFSCVESLFI